FSHHGRWVATGSRDGTARVWDAATGEPVTPPLRHSGGTPSVAFSPDDRRLIVAAWGSVSVWDLAPDGRPPEDLATLARALAGHRIDAGGGLLPDVSESPGAADGLQPHPTLEAVRSRYPDDVRLPVEEVLSWHRTAADECERSGLWIGAALHLGWLIQVEPR